MCTGKTFLIKIDSPSRVHIEREIRARVSPGALIWTDGHKSYKWLGERAPGLGLLSPVSGYRWNWVNHNRRQFAKNDEATGIRVSTNAVEGLFSRLKNPAVYQNQQSVCQQLYYLC